MYKKYARFMEGASVIEFVWNTCPDAKPVAESMFHKGFIEIFIFGTGTQPGFEAEKFWHIVFASLKFETLWNSDFDHGFLMMIIEQEATYSDISIGQGTLCVGSELRTIEVAIIDFTCKDGKTIKKIIALHPNGEASEIPDEALQ